jgi:hypothetical protein
MRMTKECPADLRQARAVLRDLLERREKLEVAIAKQRQKVAVLDDQGGDDMSPELDTGGLTNACRSALRAAGSRGLTPAELRNRLKELRFPIQNYENGLAAVHTILKRLESYKEVRVAIRNVYNGRDDCVYQWIGPQFGASRSLANMRADADRDERRRQKQK